MTVDPTPHDAPAGTGWGVDHEETFVPTDTTAGHPDGAGLILIGMIDHWQQCSTRVGRAWASGTLILDGGEAVLFDMFPSTYCSLAPLLVAGARRLVHARVDLRDAGTPRVNIRAMATVDQPPQQRAR